MECCGFLNIPRMPPQITARLLSVSLLPLALFLSKQGKRPPAFSNQIVQSSLMLWWESWPQELTALMMQILTYLPHLLWCWVAATCTGLPFYLEQNPRLGNEFLSPWAIINTGSKWTSNKYFTALVLKYSQSKWSKILKNVYMLKDINPWIISLPYMPRFVCLRCYIHHYLGVYIFHPLWIPIGPCATKIQ